MAAKDEVIVRHTAAQDTAAFDLEDFAIVFVLLFVDIPIPFGKGVIFNFYDRCVEIKWQGIFNLIHLHIVLAVFI